MATLKGKWLFNETITVPGADIEQAVNFTTAGTLNDTAYTALNCTSMLVDVSSTELLKYKVDSAAPEWEYNPAYYGAYANGLAGFYGFYEDDMRTVDFGDTEQEISDVFYEWLTSNAVEMAEDGAEETPAATITYKGSTLVSLRPGKTAILHCAGARMESDVVVEVAEQTGGGACDCFEDVTELPEVVDDNKVYRIHSEVVDTAYFVIGGEVTEQADYDFVLVDELPTDAETDDNTLYILKSMGIAYMFYYGWQPVSALVAMLTGVQVEDKGFVTDEELAAGGLADGIYLHKQSVSNYGVPNTNEDVPRAIYINDGYGWDKLEKSYLRALVDNDYIPGSHDFLIPSGTRAIRPYSFYQMTMGENVRIPDTVYQIGQYAFWRCHSLTKVDIPESVKRIDSFAFGECAGLSEVTIPSTDIIIDSHAFDDAAVYNDKSNWQDGAFYIGHHLIQTNGDCAGDFVLKEGTKVAHGGFLVFNSNVTSITFPDGFVCINKGAIGNCNNLTSVVFPASIEYVGSFIYGATPIELTVKATTPPKLQSQADSEHYTKICVPAESVDAYKADHMWSAYADIIFPIEE